MLNQHGGAQMYDVAVRVAPELGELANEVVRDFGCTDDMPISVEYDCDQKIKLASL